MELEKILKICKDLYKSKRNIKCIKFDFENNKIIAYNNLFLLEFNYSFSKHNNNKFYFFNTKFIDQILEKINYMNIVDIFSKYNEEFRYIGQFIDTDQIVFTKTINVSKCRKIYDKILNLCKRFNLEHVNFLLEARPCHFLTLGKFCYLNDNSFFLLETKNINIYIKVNS